MEQRPLRLGDIVDDYCPRERRVTNHAVVAVVEDAIRQTRCTTCDAEHMYKNGKAPIRRRKDPADSTAPTLVDAGRPPETPSPVLPVLPVLNELAAKPAHEAPAAAATAPMDATDDRPAADEPPLSMHRQLIRATLPRVEGETPAPRPIPEFTMHQRPQPRGGRGFGHGHQWHGGAGNGAGNGNVNGNGPHHNGHRPGQPMRGGQGAPNGDGRSGFGPGRPGRPQGKQRRPR